MNTSELSRKAAEVRANAYAPFSNYPVGAAVEDESGRIHTGCNVENASFGASMCAERSAIFKMISEGGKRIARIAVVTKDGAPPCGMCLQVIREFADPANPPILYLADEQGTVVQYDFEQLLPIRFDFIERTNC